MTYDRIQQGQKLTKAWWKNAQRQKKIIKYLKFEFIIFYSKHVQCLAKVFIPLNFFHVLLLLPYVNCFKLLFFSTSAYTPYTILTKHKLNCHNFVNYF